MADVNQKPTYTPAVDRVIYEGSAVGHMTQRDFIDLALAALDQGGASVKLVAQVRRLCEEAGLS